MSPHHSSEGGVRVRDRLTCELPYLHFDIVFVFLLVMSRVLITSRGGARLTCEVPCLRFDIVFVFVFVFVFLWVKSSVPITSQGGGIA